MAVSRFAYGQPAANVDTQLYLVERSALISVAVSNLSGSADLSVWIVPSGQDGTPSAWIYLANKMPIESRDTFETFKTAVNRSDKIFVKSSTGNLSFFVNGIYDVAGNTDVGVGPVFPNVPQMGSIWIDSTTVPPITRFWDGTRWKEMGTEGPSVYNPIFTMQGTLSLTTGTQRFYVERSGIISYIRATIGTPSYGSPVVVDVLKNGVSVLSTPLSIPAGEYSLKGILADSQLSVSAGDYFTVNVTGVGSVTTGANLTVTLEVQQVRIGSPLEVFSKTFASSSGYIGGFRTAIASKAFAASKGSIKIT